MALCFVFIPGARAQFGGGLRPNANNNGVPTQEPFGTIYLGGYKGFEGRRYRTYQRGFGNGYAYGYYTYAAPFPTGHYYEPGDGWRYPVYYVNIYHLVPR